MQESLEGDSKEDQGSTLAIPQVPKGACELWLLLEENDLALLLAHEPWSPPAFTKTQCRIRAVTGRVRFQFLIL